VVLVAVVMVHSVLLAVKQVQNLNLEHLTLVVAVVDTVAAELAVMVALEL
jgi:hypothetical protein